jgi:hypothetical protein
MKRVLYCSTILLALIIFFSVSPALAQVQTRVRVIQASNTGSTIANPLRDVHGQLGSLFNFSSYQLLKDETVTLSPNRPVEIPTHPGATMQIELTKPPKKDVAEVRVKVKREGSEILNTLLKLSPGKTVSIGGPKHGDGTIILAITARF